MYDLKRCPDFEGYDEVIQLIDQLKKQRLVYNLMFVFDYLPVDVDPQLSNHEHLNDVVFPIPLVGS
jgi:hypothetical protein